MKKVFLLISILLVSVALMAQTRPDDQTVDANVNSPTNVYIWGTTADTLTNADTLNFTYRVKGNYTQDWQIRLYSDFVSGTAGGTMVVSGSPDGLTFAPLDTITVSSLTADALDAEIITLDDYLQPYLKFVYLQTGTAVTIPRVYVYSKKN